MAWLSLCALFCLYHWFWPLCTEFSIQCTECKYESRSLQNLGFHSSFLFESVLPNGWKDLAPKVRLPASVGLSLQPVFIRPQLQTNSIGNYLTFKVNWPTPTLVCSNHWFSRCNQCKWLHQYICDLICLCISLNTPAAQCSRVTVCVGFLCVLWFLPASWNMSRYTGCANFPHRCKWVYECMSIVPCDLRNSHTLFC